jgi:hypothetical protein
MFSKIGLAFAAGWVAHAGTTMMHQDLLGKDRWLAHAAASWVDMPWWVGFIVFLVALEMFHQATKMTESK